MKSVAVVGAGPAGLAGAKVLLHSKKFSVTVFEKSHRLGGIWALDEDSTNGFLSPDTPTNLSKFTVGFSDLDWDSVKLKPGKQDATPHGILWGNRAPIFPKAWHVNRYLETYRQRYIPEEVIKYGYEVTRAERFDTGSIHRWKISTRTEQSQEQTTEFDYLLLGSGFFSTPRPISHNIPNISPDFSVKAIHSSRFRKLEDLFPTAEASVGKKILIIGGGNSAGEVAAAVAQQLSNARYAPETGTKQPYGECQIVHVPPRPLYALPPFTPCDETNTTFTPIDLKLYDLSRRPPGPIMGNAGRVNKTVKDMIHSALQSTIGGNQSDLGAPALEIPADEPRSTVYVALSESYPEFVRSGLINVMGGRVAALDDVGNGTATARIRHENNETELQDIGAVIYATGYSPASAVSFLSEDVRNKLHYDETSLRLPLLLQNWQTASDSVPELALLGFYEGPYWPMIEMQARLTALRWSTGDTTSELPRPYEETEKLLDMRQTMQDKGIDVPQYWFGDYAGYMEELASYLKLQRNNGTFADREGCVSPARYLSSDSDKSQADLTMQELQQIWQDATHNGKFVARAVFRALQGNWTIERKIDSSLPSFPSGTLEGEASFNPRFPTADKSGLSFDFEYLYVESGILTLSNGATMSARRRYVYRYSEERDELSAWFVKPDSELEVDYLFHNFRFVSPAEAKKEGACVARADHPCVDDMYHTEYRLPMRGISLHEFQVKHRVSGPSKDYIATTLYRRPVRKVVS